MINGYNYTKTLFVKEVSLLSSLFFDLNNYTLNLLEFLISKLRRDEYKLIDSTYLELVYIPLCYFIKVRFKYLK